jgi:hypothetical protein
MFVHWQYSQAVHVRRSKNHSEQGDIQHLRPTPYKPHFLFSNIANGKGICGHVPVASQLMCLQSRCTGSRHNQYTFPPHCLTATCLFDRFRLDLAMKNLRPTLTVQSDLTQNRATAVFSARHMTDIGWTWLRCRHSSRLFISVSKTPISHNVPDQSPSTHLIYRKTEHAVLTGVN